jgi:FtsH-binding integral membrane protein
MAIFEKVLLWQGIKTPMEWILEGSDPGTYIQTVLEAIIGLAGIIAAALIVFGAYSLITSSGEPENIAKAQKMITNALIGLVIAAIAFLIVNFVIDFVPQP